MGQVGSGIEGSIKQKGTILKGSKAGLMEELAEQRDDA
jgi:hypothetical protein